MHPLRVDSSGTMGSPSSRRLVPELSMHTAVRYKPPPLSIEVRAALRTNRPIAAVDRLHQLAH